MKVLARITANQTRESLAKMPSLATLPKPGQILQTQIELDQSEPIIGAVADWPEQLVVSYVMDNASATCLQPVTLAAEDSIPFTLATGRPLSVIDNGHFLLEGA